MPYSMIINGHEDGRRNTPLREAVSFQDRLAVTLRYLATGDSFTSLQYLFRISKQAISSIIPEVCQALIGGLKEQIKMPTNRRQDDEWLECSKEFEKLWHFPHVIGAIDGKHILIQCPFNSGAEYYNYKSQFSIVLLELVDAQYNFMYVHIAASKRKGHKSKC
ncbi:uncharacterized protein LOC124541366 [Vanessa cardui]|uniref:uncharacterized protein LOC124541366 n=1 Tax=Vanessa cardui TaxID=171605 RepID=UPI001F13232D|nr:uncharacterized protein LOC124541366 [Vanessa cardui]